MIARTQTHLQPSGFVSSWPTVWNSLLYFIWDPTISADCYRRLLKNVFVCWIIVHLAHMLFLTIIALYKSAYLLTYLQEGIRLKESLLQLSNKCLWNPDQTVVLVTGEGKVR